MEVQKSAMCSIFDYFLKKNVLLFFAWFLKLQDRGFSSDNQNDSVYARSGESDKLTLMAASAMTEANAWTIMEEKGF